MRKQKYSIADKNEITDFLNDSIVGILSMIDPDGFPYSVCVNYLYKEDKFYFHSSKSGWKFLSLDKNPQAAFIVFKEYSVIPSHFSGSDIACNITEFYKSVHIRGTVKLIEEDNSKVLILNDLMKKFQPELGFKNIELTDKDYSKNINLTAVFELTPLNISAKYNFGQNYTKERLNNIINGLRKRGTKLDTETADMIKKYNDLNL